MDAYVKQVNSLPREEATSRRVSVVKLQRDYERLSLQFTNLQKDHGALRVDRTIQNPSSDSFSNAYDNSQNAPPLQQQQQQQFMPQLNDVDDAIIEERERDIKKINQDLHLVNEMFKYEPISIIIMIIIIITIFIDLWLILFFSRDMANIVEKHGGIITKIEEDSEVSKDRAKEGLDQVTQAAKYQPTCLIS